MRTATPRTKARITLLAAVLVAPWLTVACDRADRADRSPTAAAPTPQERQSMASQSTSEQQRMLESAPPAAGSPSTPADSTSPSSPPSGNTPADTSTGQSTGQSSSSRP